jgi:hypothetical protein
VLDRFCDVTVRTEKLGTDVVAVAVVVFASNESAVSIEKPARGSSFRVQVVPFDDFPTAIPGTPDDPVMQMDCFGNGSIVLNDTSFPRPGEVARLVG